ncbi:DUF3656 domain-containing protein [soil metagenome]
MSQSIAIKRPEILAPAGNEEMMRAAVENGADAIYFGVQQFNARLRAANFDLADLPKIMSWLHERGVKGYVTMNTLIFTDELPAAAEALIAFSNAGVDAVLIQDLGLAQLANEIAPELSIHASTQMTVTSAESVQALDEMGLRLDRVVAAREMSRRDLRRMAEHTDKEVEVFVHGAICVAYSGQCLTSEALGGRSANRGECAQACRLPYDLIVDGKPYELDGLKYLLSPKDLAAYEDIGDLMDIGIVSLKIEGRLKSPQYVAATVQSYRAAIDQAIADGRAHMEEATRRKLEMTFSRGFTGGYIHETNHQAVVEGRFPKKRGLLIGEVLQVRKNGILAHVTGPVKAGDGLVFDAGNPDVKEEGGRVYELFRGSAPLKSFDPQDEPATDLEIRFGRNDVDLNRINTGDLLYKTSDPKLDAELAASYEGDQIRHRRPVNAHVTGAIGRALTLELEHQSGISVRVEDTAPAEAALKRPLTEDSLRDQLGRLGGTPFELANLTAELHGDLMVPMSRLNDLRRRAVEALVENLRTKNHSRPINPNALTKLREGQSISSLVQAHTASPILSVLCRTLEQVKAAVSADVHTIYTDFEDIRLHREARALIPSSDPRFAPATLRILKPGEVPFVRKLIEAEPDAVLVRNLASWKVLREIDPGLELIGDYSLNVSNDLTARLMHRHGLHVQTPSYDLNIEQLLSLLGAAPPEWFEVTAHQYMPMFHMEHCVFCRFLSEGTDFTNCGRPCETHTVALRDRMGYEHALKADAGCRNTVFNATAQSASAYLAQIVAAGVRRFRVDLLNESGQQTRAAIDGYLSVLRGEREGAALWKDLRASSKLGVTKGSLDHE